MIKLKNLVNLFKAIKNLFSVGKKNTSQFLLSLKNSEYSKVYAFYFYKLIENVEAKNKKKTEVKKVVNKHEKIRARILDLANVKKTKYQHDEYTNKFFEILNKSENVNTFSSMKREEIISKLKKEADEIKISQDGMDFLSKLKNEIKN